MQQKVDLTKPYVELTIEDGEQKVEAHNFVGQECLKHVQDIQKLLGGEVQSKTNKPELYQTAAKPQAVIKHQ